MTNQEILSDILRTAHKTDSANNTNDINRLLKRIDGIRFELTALTDLLKREINADDTSAIVHLNNANVGVDLCQCHLNALLDHLKEHY